jgi:hypothetical protein
MSFCYSTSSLIGQPTGIGFYVPGHFGLSNYSVRPCNLLCDHIIFFRSLRLRYGLKDRLRHSRMSRNWVSIVGPAKGMRARQRHFVFLLAPSGFGYRQEYFLDCTVSLLVSCFP